MFITNAGTQLSRLVTITARTGDDEISNIVVENGTPGYEQSAPLKKMGWRSSDTRELTFSGCRVPEGNLLGPRGAGFRQFLEILDGGRISVAALGLGMAQGAFEMALRYAGEREQFGRPIGRFQAVQFKLADMATEIEAGRNLVLQGGVAQGRGPGVRAGGRDRQALHRRAGPAGVQRVAADPRRLRLHGRVPGQPLLPRRQGARDRRGDERDPAARDRARPGPVTAFQSVQVAGVGAGGGGAAGDDRVAAAPARRLAPRRAGIWPSCWAARRRCWRCSGPYLQGRIWPGAAIIAAGYGGFYLIRTRQLRRADRDGVRRLLGLEKNASYGEALSRPSGSSHSR